ncbi:replication/maintenance protein RepL, partial [Escherichia coli]
MLEQRFEDFEQQKRRDHKAQDQAQNTKQKRDRLNPPDWSQVTKAGWNMLDAISEKVPRAFRLYSFFAQNIDKSCGAVVCDQKFLADYFGVSLRTIQYWIGDLERIGAIVKIPVGIYYAYALDPYQVWRGYNKSKKYAAF